MMIVSDPGRTESAPDWALSTEGPATSQTRQAPPYGGSVAQGTSQVEREVPVPPRPIETLYAGCRFRSRLEARWAIFLDALGVLWEYEIEGFDLDGLWYLPDFWLPSLEAWLEVKGQSVKVGDASWEKAHRLAEETEHSVFLFTGQFPETPNNVMGIAVSPFSDWGGEGRIPPGDVWWFQCPGCEHFQPGPSIYDLPCACHREPAPNDNPTVRQAVLAARQSRFESGKGGPR